MNKDVSYKGKSELLIALEQLEREKNIDKIEILKTITDALVSALRKYFGKTAQITAEIDPDTGEIKGFMIKKVVDEVFSPELEISLSNALKINPDAKIDQDINIPVDIKDFSRMAALTAKQVLVQKIREIEKMKLYEEFKPREGEIVTGIVHHVSSKDVFVDLGKAEAILPFSEQIRKEHYKIHDRIRAIIHRVDKENRGLQIILSRASPFFLKALLEAEVPEIGEKIVEVIQVVRDPGFRSKVIVKSNSSKIDPVGACVGVRGSRIRVIMDETCGEKIDLIPFSDDISQMIMKSLAPANVSSVKIIDKDLKRARVIVPDDQLSVAIGREGQNIKLVSRLTGWDIEIKSEGQKGEEEKQSCKAITQDLRKIDGIGPKAAETLIKMGITEVRQLENLKAEDLSSLQGIGEKTAQKIINGVQKYVSENAGDEHQPGHPSGGPRVSDETKSKSDKIKEQGS
jgi:N utilization substance protein A